MSELEKCFGDNFWGIGRCFQLINDVVNNKTKLSNDEVVQAFKGKYVKIGVKRWFLNIKKHTIPIPDWIPSEENEQCGQERALATTGDVQEAESGNNGKTESTTHTGEEEEIYMDVTMEEQVPASESDDEVFPNPTPAKVESKPRLLLCDDYIRGTLDAESVKSKTGGRRKRFSDKSVLVTSEKEAHIFTPKTVPREKSKLKYTEPHFIEPKKRRKN